MSMPNSMTPELWQKLEEMAGRSELTLNFGDTHPSWLISLSSLGYLNSVNWGPGGCYDVYTISPKGRQALADYKANPSPQKEGQEEARTGEAELLARVVPTLLNVGLSIEQIAQQLQVSVGLVTQIAQSKQSDS